MSESSPEIRKLYARPGEPVTVRKWNDLLRYVESLINALSGMIGPGLLKDEYGTGFFLRAEEQPAQAFVGAFYVSGGSESLTIGIGTVDGEIPTLGGKLIDGTESNGEIPTLEPVDGPNEKLRSWVCIEAFADPDTKALREEEPLIITHRNTLEAEPGVGIRPVALLQWSDQATISQIHQIVYFQQSLTISESQGKLILRFSADA